MSRAASNISGPMLLERTGDGLDELIQACRHGERAALGELFELYKDRVYSIALRYCGDSTAAMDLAQVVFLKLYTRIADYRAESSFDTWLYRLVVNTCIDRFRRERRWLPVFLDTLADTFRTADTSALDRMLEGEQASAVQGAVAKLPASQRMAVVLRYTENLSYEEIAQAMGCSAGTIASRLNRAHKTLAKKLARARG